MSEPEIKKRLTERLRFIVPVSLAIYFVLRFFSSALSDDETVEVRCTFQSIDKDGIPVPYKGGKISRLTYQAQLRGKSVDAETGVADWRSEGTVSYLRQTELMRGSIHISSDGRFIGFFIYPDKSIREGTDFSIGTLSANGMLDWNEDTVFIWFEGAPTRTRYSFHHDCRFVESERWLGLF